jgi:hypothetical protein
MKRISDIENGVSRKLGTRKQENYATCGMRRRPCTFDARQYLFLPFPGKLSDIKNLPSAKILMPSSAEYEIRSPDLTTWISKPTQP